MGNPEDQRVNSMCSSLLFLCRNISETLLRVELNILDWKTNITAVNESNHTAMSFCAVLSHTMNFLSLIITLVGLIGNITVLCLLGFQVHRNAFSVYILNLAGADFLFTCFQIGYCFHVILDIPIKFPLFSFVVLNFVYLCGLNILSAISIERCLSVRWPIWYRCQWPRHTSAVICSLLWVLYLVLSLMEGNKYGFLLDISSSGWCKTLDLVTTALLIVLFVVLLGSSLALVITIFCGLQKTPVTRMHVAIVFSVLLFLPFGLPYGIYWFLLV